MIRGASYVDVVWKPCACGLSRTVALIPSLLVGVPDGIMERSCLVDHQGKLGPGMCLLDEH